MSKYFEVTEPHYALIIAENEKELTDIYCEKVTDNEPIQSFQILNAEKAAIVCQEAYEHYVDVCLSKGMKYLSVDNYLGNPVILIDGSLT